MKLAFSLVTTVALAVTACSGSPTKLAQSAPRLTRETVAPTTVAVPTTTTTIPMPTSTVASTTTTTTSTTLPDIVLASLSTEPPTLVERVICAPKWEWDCEEALAVSWCESWHNPGSVSKPNRDGTIDRGIFQVNDVWREAFSPNIWANILDLETNVAMAHHIWKTGNDSWLYWTCQP